MSMNPLCVTANLGLVKLINSALNGHARVDIVAEDAVGALGSSLLTNAGQNAILIVDAQITQDGSLVDDTQGRPAMNLLRQLRSAGNNIPALVITTLPAVRSELEQYCEPRNSAIALPLRHLNAANIALFIDLVTQRPLTNSWDVIEIDVTRHTAQCFVGRRGGSLINWDEVSLPNRLIERLAYLYDRPEFTRGWARDMHFNGTMLFNDLVIGALGRGLFSHLESAAGGLQRLAFRFRVDDASLYSVPFEAAVRESALQPLLNNETDYTHHPFVLVCAPIARRMKSITIRRAPIDDKWTRPVKLLFIRSQIGDSATSATDSALLQLKNVVQEDGRTRITHVEFRRLQNIDRELADLKELSAKRTNIVEIHSLDLSDNLNAVSAEISLKNALEGNQFDVVHFAGHSITTVNGVTLLVLPSGQVGEAVGLQVQTFADWVSATGPRLVYLSSCQGSSASTVASIGQRGVPHVVGFRWDVDDGKAADFAQLFYAELLQLGQSSVASAFLAACKGLYHSDQIEASPTWASPILASMSDNWMN